MSLPISVIIATRNRPAVLERTLQSFLEQSPCPKEIILADASTNSDTSKLATGLTGKFKSLGANLIYLDATKSPGAAPQRNAGLQITKQANILFADDDIILEPHCLERLYKTLSSDTQIGGVSSTITNQVFTPLGKISLLVLRAVSRELPTSPKQFAGRVIGPTINFLPSDDENRPEIAAVDWLNTTCTLYRRKALPEGIFPKIFWGASHGEDLALSLLVGKGWKLVNSRSARIFHDSQPGDHKSDQTSHARMEFTNRRFILNEILEDRSARGLAGLTLWTTFVTLAGLRSHGQPMTFAQRIFGLLQALTSAKPTC